MNQKNNLVKNASFLMVAAMISKVIGLLYKSPLSSIVGNMGMGYISLAQNAYMILLMIASFSIPQAVSKLISERIALKDYKNAQKIFHGSLIYAAIVGGIVALVCLFGARFIIPSNQPNAVLALQILSPTIFLSGILGVYRGYFQAYRNMMPTSISQILEQIFNAAVSLIAAWMFIKYFADGTDGSVAIILSSFIYNINGYLNGVLYSEIMGKHGVNADMISMMYAEYATYFMSIINIPLTLSSAAPTSMIPEVSALYATGDIDETRRRVDQTVQLSMFISIPCAVGLAVLAQPIVLLLFGGTNGVAGKLLMLGSFTILLNGMSNISNGVLQGIGKPKIPMITAAVALVVDVIVVVALLMFTDLGIYALLVAMIVYAIVVCVMNDFFMKKYLGYKNPWKAAYVSPLIASAVMGVVAAGVYYGFHAILPSNIICLGVSIILAAAAYFLVYILVDKTASERLSRMPGGAYLVRIAQRIRR